MAENTAPREGLTNSTQYTVPAREVDFVTRFALNWDALREILGIMRPIRKTPGTKLVSYKASVDGDLKGGTTVAEGEVIPLTKLKVEPVAYSDIEFAKHARIVSIEAVAKYGATVAVQRTDEAFLTAIQNEILSAFYKFMLTGSLTLTETTWQRALAMAKGKVLEKFAGMDRDVTEVVGFANILDAYDYLGDKDITVQSIFGLNYLKDFLGYRTVFLLPEKYIEKGKVVAIPVENIDLYYIDPADSEFAALGLNFRVAGEQNQPNLIGVHVEGDYSRVTGDMTAIYGMKLWAEYIDGIAIATVNPNQGAALTTPTKEQPLDSSGYGVDLGKSVSDIVGTEVDKTSTDTGWVVRVDKFIEMKKHIVFDIEDGATYDIDPSGLTLEGGIATVKANSAKAVAKTSMK